MGPGLLRERKQGGQRAERRGEGQRLGGPEWEQFILQ